MEVKLNRGRQSEILNDNFLDPYKYEVEHHFGAYGINMVRQPHEWKFIYMFYKKTLVSHLELTNPLLAFIHQYYPNYRFSIPEHSLTSILVECDQCNMLFEQFYEYKIYVDISKAVEFGNIITEFMIRYLGYSLIGFCNQKFILTAQSNCIKRFQSYLEKDYYTIYRLARLAYTDGVFSKLPVLSTRETYLQFDEYIEDEDGNRHLVLK